jgi:hypothetical protein
MWMKVLWRWWVLGVSQSLEAMANKVAIKTHPRLLNVIEEQPEVLKYL